MLRCTPGGRQVRTLCSIVLGYMEKEHLSRLLLQTRGLTVLGGVLRSPASGAVLSLLESLAEENPRPAAVAAAYGRAWRELSAVPETLLPDAWQSHLVERLLDDENPFSLRAEKGGPKAVAAGLLEQARRDLRVLQALCGLRAEDLRDFAAVAVPGAGDSWTPWKGLSETVEDSPRGRFAQSLAAAEDWGACAEDLAGHFATHGAGVFGRYRAFRWRAGSLEPVPDPDPVSLRDLVGYEEDRRPLLRNTERFLAGLPAHHALVYGLPGTGKSSTVKAVMNNYAGRGLRAVEVAKEDLGGLPELLGVLRGRGMCFVLFVDDLSFEEYETEYKPLKALLEGSLEAPPGNVRLYATSNRRNLIRERFSDREDGSGDEVHARDTMQEKLSLAARFGLRLTFPTPDQKEYLDIVAGIARERGLRIPADTLAERARLWDRWHAGRSGRTARQLVDELEAELADS